MSAVHPRHNMKSYMQVFQQKYHPEIVCSLILIALSGFVAVAFFPFQEASAAGDYCWCVRPDGICENHRVNAAGADIACGASGDTSCTAYCASRDTGGTAWRSANCDTSYVARASESSGPADAPVCPPSDTPSIPATEPAGGAPADTSAPPPPITLYNPLGGDVTIAEFIGRGIRAVIGIVGALALLMFIYGGIVWMTAGGSQDRITSAKNILKNSFIGIMLIFFSYTIISIFFSFLNG